eukprot:CAMPEP_0113566040 /NCGR_PEP_ID=MMETSP0015_2-20120614/22506_1 /TAXON_ID=2838 /ORGANISM="Odontella" /LENGTH=176 /DNA_ID=CAMNT_0000468293 /DNA_START=141 /DNA_END=671 /DNA_ORIENTATION=+ /assembly_acc=CAM_ASM_000160
MSAELLFCCTGVWSGVLTDAIGCINYLAPDSIKQSVRQVGTAGVERKYVKTELSKREKELMQVRKSPKKRKAIEEEILALDFLEQERQAAKAKRKAAKAERKAAKAERKAAKEKRKAAKAEQQAAKTTPNKETAQKQQDAEAKQKEEHPPIKRVNWTKLPRGVLSRRVHGSNNGKD